MNNDQFNELLNGLGAMIELYTITYQSFKKQGHSDDDAIKHTKTFMSVFMESVIANGGQNNGN